MRPRGGCALASAALAVLLAQARTAAAEAVSFPAREVRVEVTIGADARAFVREEYVLTRAVDAAAFELLDVPCSRLGPITSVLDSRAIAFDATRRARWTRLRATGIAAAAGAIWRIEYPVETGGGEATVPLVLPAATLERLAGTRGAAVTIAVTFAGDGEAALPRFDHDAGSRTWRARLLALPSVIRVRVPAAAPVACDAATAGTSGGLEWRFWIFVATMAIWVPVYLWWFGRRRAGEDD